MKAYLESLENMLSKDNRSCDERHCIVAAYRKKLRNYRKYQLLTVLTLGLIPKFRKRKNLLRSKLGKQFGDR